MKMRVSAPAGTAARQARAAAARKIRIEPPVYGWLKPTGTLAQIPESPVNRTPARREPQQFRAHT
jgi:hypothetical protein